jgi:hypothetical protein
MSGLFLFSFSLFEISFRESTCGCFRFLWKILVALPSFIRVKSGRFAGLLLSGVTRISSLVFCNERWIARTSVFQSVMVFAAHFFTRLRMESDRLSSSYFSLLLSPVFSMSV